MMERIERRRVWRRISPLLLAAGLALAPWPASAQDSISSEMQKMQQFSGVDRNIYVSNIMNLTGGEGAVFWPVYESYLNDLDDLNRTYADIVNSYVNAVQNGTLDDNLAGQLTTRFLAAEEKELALRKTYAANLAKVLPGVTAARAVQLENKIRAVVWFGLASRLPLARQ
jgi:hypothetical protein